MKNGLFCVLFYEKLQNLKKRLDFEAYYWYNVVRREVTSFFCVKKNASNINDVKYGGVLSMRVKITLACSECKQRNYNTMKNKKNDPDRLEMNKYCRFCRKHTLHKETK